MNDTPHVPEAPGRMTEVVVTTVVAAAPVRVFAAVADPPKRF